MQEQHARSVPGAPTPDERSVVVCRELRPRHGADLFMETQSGVTVRRDVSGKRLKVTRTEILAFRRRVGALDQRLPRRRSSLRRAAWAGLQDSMPRAALLSLNARVEGVGPTAWEDPSLVQVWGPRYNVYVVAVRDAPLFTLGRLPDGGKIRRGRKTWRPACARSSGPSG